MAQDVQAWLIHHHATTIPTICTPFHHDARQWYHHNSQQYYLKIMTSITANRAILIKVWFIEVWCCDDEFSHEFCWAITLSILSCWYFLSILVGIDVSYQPPKFWVKQWGRFFSFVPKVLLMWLIELWWKWKIVETSHIGVKGNLVI